MPAVDNTLRAEVVERASVALEARANDRKLVAMGALRVAEHLLQKGNTQVLVHRFAFPGQGLRASVAQ